MVRQLRPAPDPDPNGKGRKQGRRPKATLAAWVAVVIAAAEVLTRIFQ